MMDMLIPGLTLILSLLAQAFCSGMFEVSILAIYNYRGLKEDKHCCAGSSNVPPCSIECRTFFTICLLHYTASISDHQYCTFGSKITPVLGGNTINETALSVLNYFPLKIDFSFSWPTNFSLVLEVWHDSYRNISTTDVSQRIMRVIIKDSLEPNSNWKEASAIINKAEFKYKYRVICDESYYGTSCDRVCRSRDDNFGHYICDENGTKICLPGWEGEFCTKAVCSTDCNLEHGSCEKPFECRCDAGWSVDASCNKCLPDPNCVNGYCHIPWQCICNEGWDGKYCSIDKNYCTKYTPCLNGGTCISNMETNFTCNCTSGYTGEKCDTLLCFNGYCQNGGLCQNNISGPVCACPHDYYGKHCEFKLSTCDEIICSNNGSCYIGDYGAMCACQSGFTGIFCDKEIDECRSNPCKNDGICRDGYNGYYCNCTAGYIGKNCDIVLNPCMGVMCYHGGTCIISKTGFSPKCQCAPGFTGYRCEIPLDPCNGIKCQNGGICKTTNSGRDPWCHCLQGYRGYFCEEETCSNLSCHNGGVCKRHLHEFICVCDSHFGGKLCEKLLIPSDQAITQPSDIPNPNSVNSCKTIHHLFFSYLNTLLSLVTYILLHR